MSQPSSSMVSAENADLKYKKALKEISKLIQANRVLRQSTDQSTRQLKEKIDELSLRYQDLEKEYEVVKKQKESLSNYLDDLQKQKKNIQRENSYLTDSLAQKNAELQKAKSHKDQKAVATLIRTYEEKQASLNRSRLEGENMIQKLKQNIRHLESQLEQQRNNREGSDDRYANISLELAKHREMNSTLLSQNERLLSESSNKDSYCIEKQRELQSLIADFRTQLSILKSKPEEHSNLGQQRYLHNYEILVNEKASLETELSRLRQAFGESMGREKQFFQMEERMKAAIIRAERANEEANMLKNKIIVMEAKDFLQEAGDDDYDQKEFEERLNMLTKQNDPIVGIKNGEDTSHFRIMKAFIVDLQDKIFSLSQQKKEYIKKYKSVKAKFMKNSEQLAVLEERNKLLRGKVEGFERLTDKLQFELEKNISSNEEEITRMTITSNNMLSIKNQQYKSAMAILNQDLDLIKDKADRTEKNMRQQIETLKLQLETLRIKYNEETENYRKNADLINIMKNKNSEYGNKIGRLDEELLEANETARKFQELFREEKGKNQGLLSQKQHLIAQNKQLTEQMDRKTHHLNESLRLKEHSFEQELKRYRNDNLKMKEQLDYSLKEVKTLRSQIDSKRYDDQTQFDELRKITNKNIQLEEVVARLKRQVNELQDERGTLSLKAAKYLESYERCNRLEEEIIYKNDALNDLTRQKMMVDNDLKSIQNHLEEEKKIYSQLEKTMSQNKMKSLEDNHDLKKQFQNRLLENKKTIQSLQQQNADLANQLREQKSKNVRLNHELTTARTERDRGQELLSQGRKKQLLLQKQLTECKLQLSNSGMETQKLQSELRQKNKKQSLNQEIQILQQRVFSLNQENSGLKMKVQTADEEKNQLLRDLNSIKSHYNTVNTHLNKMKQASNLPWEEQNFVYSLNDIVAKVRKIGKLNNILFESSVAQPDDNQRYYRSHTVSGAQRSQSHSQSSSGVRVIGGYRLNQNTSLQMRSGNQYGITSSPQSGIRNNFEQKIDTTQSINNGSYMQSGGSTVRQEATYSNQQNLSSEAQESIVTRGWDFRVIQS